MARTKAAVLLAAALAPAPVHAVPLLLQGPIAVDVREDGKSTTYSAVLTASAGGPISKVDLQASPLLGRGRAAGTVIPAANVTVGELSFAAAGTRTVPITIASVSRTGTYSGTLTAKGGDAPVTVDLELVLHPAVAVKPSAESVEFTQLRCLNAVTCWLGELLTPRALEGGQRRLGIDSSTAEVLHVDHVTGSLDGEKTQTSLTVGAVEPWQEAAGAPVVSALVQTAESAQVRLAVPPELVAQGRSYATMTFERGAVPADRYRGVVRVFLKESQDPVLIPFILDVRHGPILAALLVLAGILVGRKLQKRSRPTAQLREAAVESYHQFQDEVNRLRDARARTLMRIDLESLRRLAVADPPNQGQIEALRCAIHDKLSQLETVQDLDAVIPDGNAGLVRDAIDRILAGDAGAAAAIEALREAVTAPAPEAPRRQILAISPMPPAGTRQRLASGLGVVAGTAWDRTERDWHLVRPLLGVLLLILLGFVGFQSLYLNGSSTFGSGGVFDYMPLFLWGLSADIAQRTLLTLPAVRGG